MNYSFWSFSTQIEDGDDVNGDGEDLDTEHIPPEWKEPKNFNEAVKNTLWRKSMRREIRALKESHTWTLTPLPEGRKPIKMKWVFKIKKQGGIPVQLKSVF
jgi:hypothetical protein